MQAAVKSVPKLITFSSELYRLVLDKAKRLGLSFGEYVRVLVVNDVKKEVESIPMVDEETEKRIGESLKDYREGKYTVLKSDKDIENYFKNL
ncbi:hypothetical protein HY357_03615 [Candidatus Roizmanbacteria bacterium]|nr:hypothetical protein [Candidatus Roizmanbacteria bacterium]